MLEGSGSPDDSPRGHRQARDSYTWGPWRDGRGDKRTDHRHTPLSTSSPPSAIDSYFDQTPMFLSPASRRECQAFFLNYHTPSDLKPGICTQPYPTLDLSSWGPLWLSAPIPTPTPTPWSILKLFLPACMYPGLSYIKMYLEGFPWQSGG